MTTRPKREARPAEDRYGLTTLPDPPNPTDATQQRPHVARTDQVLSAYFAHRPDVLVSFERCLCHLASDARQSPHPGLLVSFGLEIPPDVIEDMTNGYTIVEVGKPPEFVLEAASETTARCDETVKRETCAGLGISEYRRFDRTGGHLYATVPVAGEEVSRLRAEPRRQQGQG